MLEAAMLEAAMLEVEGSYAGGRRQKAAMLEAEGKRVFLEK